MPINGPFKDGMSFELINETTTGAGVRYEDANLQSDSILVTLYVSSISSGTLTLELVGLTGPDGDDAVESDPLISFPAVSSPTTTMLLRAGAVITQRVRLRATYTGVCTYTVTIRAINGGVSSSTRILASDSMRMSQQTVGTSVVAIIPAALLDRAGVVIKNWSTTQTVYLGATVLETTLGNGFPLAPKDGLAVDIAAGVEIYGISDAPGADIRIAESGG